MRNLLSGFSTLEIGMLVFVGLLVVAAIICAAVYFVKQHAYKKSKDCCEECCGMCDGNCSCHNYEEHCDDCSDNCDGTCTCHTNDHSEEYNESENQCECECHRVIEIREITEESLNEKKNLENKPDYNTLTRVQLLEECKKLGITGVTRLKKEEILQKLLND